MWSIFILEITAKQDSVYMLFRPYNEEISADIQTMFCKISWITHSLGQYTLNLFNCENFRENFQYILKYLLPDNRAVLSILIMHSHSRLGALGSC